MKLILVSILVMLSVACSKKANNTYVPGISLDNSIENPQTISFLALGDSYTIGESVKQEESFPYQLKEGLKKYDMMVSDPRIVARTGWTTDELQGFVAREDPAKKFDFVTLLIGVNNQFRGYSKDTYRREFKELLISSTAFAGGDTSKVFVLSIPDWGYTPYGGDGTNKIISKDIDAFNAINKEETLKMGISYIDITPVSREAVNDKALIASDGLHPSGKMYNIWAESLISRIRPVL